METKLYNIPQKITTSLGINNVTNVIDQLPVNKNYSWAELEVIKQGQGNGRPRTLEDIEIIVLHHDAIPKATSANRSDIQLMQNIANTHIRSTANRADGDGGYPYDFTIRNGMIYQCNDLLPLKFGVKSNNHNTLHVMVSGEYSAHDVLTDPDRKCLVGLVTALKADLPNFKAIKGHKELIPTKCPGYDHKQIRNDVVTLESNLAYKETPNAQTAIAFTIATRILNLYETAKADGPYKDEAIRKLLLLEPVCKELNLI